MEILATRDRQFMRQCEAALLAQGVPLRWFPGGGPGVMLLDVPASETEHASALLAEQLGEELARPGAPIPVGPRVPLVLQPAFAAALCLALAMVGFFVHTGPVALRGEWFRLGVLTTAGWEAGEVWRLVTAATLHADGEHALGNAVFTLVLGWALGERVGVGAMLAIMVAAAVAGFGVSLGFSEIGSTLGASGGVFGLLGGAAAHGVKTGRDALGLRRHLFRVVGGAVMLLAFTAFGPRSNIHAHVGGFVAGLVLGGAVPRVPPSGLIQSVLATAAGAGVVGAWLLARG